MKADQALHKQVESYTIICKNPGQYAGGAKRQHKLKAGDLQIFVHENVKGLTLSE